MMIVADIGGTYVRFALAVGDTYQEPQKYKALDFKSFNEALAHFVSDANIPEVKEICIAAAGAPLGDVWKITNNEAWDIDLNALIEDGWNIPVVLNDFESGTYSLPLLKDHDLKTLHQGIKNDHSLCLLGPGTGLGLGYYHSSGSVQKTHGGHMPIACVTDEQWDAVKEFQKSKTSPVVYEDFVSGQNNFAKTNSELFHEFLGLFAAQSLIHGHAYGGLYLMGGVIQGLIKEDLFNFDTFHKYMCLGGVECVSNDLRNTPIHFITEPYPAFKGLIHAKSLSNN